MSLVTQSTRTPHVSSSNFFRPVPYDTLNARLLDAARHHQYDVLIAHLFEQEKRCLASAAWYDDEAFEKRPGMQRLYDTFKTNASAWQAQGRKRVLEVGIGSGTLAWKLAGLGYDVTGLDASAPRVMMCHTLHPERRQGLSIRFMFGITERMPFDDDQFDFIISQHVLEHVFDLGRTMDEISRVAKSDALFIHEIPQGDFADGANHLRHFSRDAIYRILDSSPFHLNSIEMLPYLTGESPECFLVLGRVVKR